MLETVINNLLDIRAVTGLFYANASGDDILVKDPTGEGITILHHLRQQIKSRVVSQTYVWLILLPRKDKGHKDFIRAFGDKGFGSDELVRIWTKITYDYHAISRKALLNRMAEAATEFLHLKIRKSPGIRQKEQPATRITDFQIQRHQTSSRISWFVPTILERIHYGGLLWCGTNIGIRLTESRPCFRQPLVKRMVFGASWVLDISVYPKLKKTSYRTMLNVRGWDFTTAKKNGWVHCWIRVTMNWAKCHDWDLEALYCIYCVFYYLFASFRMVEWGYPFSEACSHTLGSNTNTVNIFPIDTDSVDFTFTKKKICQFSGSFSNYLHIGNCTAEFFLKVVRLFLLSDDLQLWSVQYFLSLKSLSNFSFSTYHIEEIYWACRLTVQLRMICTRLKLSYVCAVRIASCKSG